MSGLDRLNAMPDDEAEALLVGLCASPAWARALVVGRPYADVTTLLESARVVWDRAGPEEWRLAFAGHPRIGEQGGQAPERSAREQSGLGGMDAAVAAAIAQGNREYESRFGYVFLIRAAGRSPAEILEQLERRLQHEPDEEIAVAAEQQAEITALRLAGFLA